MGCNCKEAKRIDKLFNFNDKKYDKKGARYFFDKILYVCAEALNRLIMIVLLVVLTPIVILTLIFKLLFGKYFGFKISNKLFNILKDGEQELQNKD
jgi:hypothetical protein